MLQKEQIYRNQRNHEIKPNKRGRGDRPRGIFFVPRIHQGPEGLQQIHQGPEGCSWCRGSTSGRRGCSNNGSGCVVAGHNGAGCVTVAGLPLVGPYFLPRAHRKLFSPHLTIGARPRSPQDPGPRTIPDRNGPKRTGTYKAPRILPYMLLFFSEIKQFCFSFCLFLWFFSFLFFFRSSCCRSRSAHYLSIIF